MSQPPFRLTGLIPATFTPMLPDGNLNLDAIGPVVERLIGEGVHGLYVCGSTGEGVSLTREERCQVVDVYVEAAAGRIPVIVQVGHNSLAEACRLAAHAQRAGADAISATPPMYFKPRTVETIVDCLAEIVEGAPDLPFYYYHIPGMTGVQVDLPALLMAAAEKLPNFVGAKYSTSTVNELQVCAQLQGGRFNLLFGSDEMLLSGLCGGAHGAVGTTYNFAAPLFLGILKHFGAGNLDEARRLQGLAANMVYAILRYGGIGALKAVMSFVGPDCGPPRLPNVAPDREQVAHLRTELEGMGYFEWGR